MVNTRGIFGELPGYNRVPSKTKKGWNTDFQSYNPPMAYKVLEQDKKGGAMLVMLIAAVIGGIIAICVL